MAMVRLMDFFKTCAVGGLFVLMPLLIFILLLQQALGAVIALATPIADLFPVSTFEKIETPSLVAIVLILATSFLFGLGLRSRVLSRFGSWFEDKTIRRLPMYSAIKHLTAGFDESELGFRPALLHSPDDIQELVYLVEQHDDGRSTVLVPRAPASFSGAVKVVPSSRLEILNGSLADASRVISLWGVGMADLLPTTPTAQG
jgi:uncharacterized membrane protein